MLTNNYIVFLSLLPLIYIGFALCFHKSTPTLTYSISKSSRPPVSEVSSEVLYYTSRFRNNDLYVCENKDLRLFSDYNDRDVELQPPVENPRFTLPELTPHDKLILASGGIVKKQERNGSRGSGFAVVDILFPSDIVFDTLTQFASYQYMIPVVRSSKIISSDGVNVVAEFALSRFLLRANIKHTVSNDERLIQFMLDTSRVNLVFKEAQGFWHVQIPKDRPEGYCRVYLSAHVVADSMIPSPILDYAVSCALSKATRWVKPFFLRKVR